MAIRPGKPTAAVAYLRTSSAANVGADRDSDKRQRAAIEAYAKAAGITITETFYDAAVSGADPVDTRPGFAAMLKLIESNGVRTIIVETANRFARDLMVQEVGYAVLRERGISLIAADSPSSFLDDTPTAKLIRQVLGAVSEFDKAMTVAKLRGARDRKRRDSNGQRRKVEGRKRIGERTTQEGAERGDGATIVAEAKRLARQNPKTGKGRSLREISAELARLGHLNAKGNPFSASSVKALLKNTGP